MRQWKQWCTEHKEDKAPTDVVSFFFFWHTALNFLVILTAFVSNLEGLFISINNVENFGREMFCAEI